MGCQSSGHTLFEQAGKTAIALLSSFQPGDELFLITSTDTTREQSRSSFHDFSLLQKQIGLLTLDARPTRYAAALHLADRLLSSSQNLNKELYLIADMQRSGFTTDSLRSQLQGMRRFAIPLVPRSLSNLSCLEVRLLSAILQKDKVLEGQVMVRNSGTVSQHNRLVQIFINRKQVAQSTIDLEPGAAVGIDWKCVLDQTGFVSGYAQLEEDDWLEDNRSYFCFHVPEEIRIGLVGAETSTGYFLQLGLKPNPNLPSRFILEPIKSEQLAYQQPDLFDVVALCDVSLMSSEMAEWLHRFVDSGKGLLFVLGSHIDLKSYNQELTDRLGLAPCVDVIGSSQDQQTSFSLGQSDLTHPIFSGLFEAEKAYLGDPVFHFAIRCRPTPTMNPIIRFSSGDPFLYEVRRPTGALLVFTSGFSENLTDLPYRALFAPLMHRSISWLQTAGRFATPPAHCGDPLRFRLPADALGKALLVHRPDDAKEKPTIGGRGENARWVEYGHTDLPGIYSLLDQDQTLHQWAVNLPSAELELQPIDRDALEKSYQFHTATSAEELTAEIQQQRIGREWWKDFLLAGLLLLVVEMALYYERAQE